MDNVSANMAEFALGYIATMASNNPNITLDGHLPIPGSQLDVIWPSAIALLVCILVVHTALSAFAFYANWYNKIYLLGEDNS